MNNYTSRLTRYKNPNAPKFKTLAQTAKVCISKSHAVCNQVLKIETLMAVKYCFISTAVFHLEIRQNKTDHCT